MYPRIPEKGLLIVDQKEIREGGTTVRPTVYPSGASHEKSTPRKEKQLCLSSAQAGLEHGALWWKACALD